MKTADAFVPDHLKRYVVEQNYGRYTPIDQAVWRFIMRQLRHFLSKNAHPIYLEGLDKTGISVERIPDISEMSRKLSEFGWKAIPVSGFIPPAAFMEMQSLGILPIASDMRTLEHLTYTPAPDIVHEAAGHAPILVDPEFSKYLHAYALVAKKAIINHEDLEIYESIRELSDLKEDPSATAEQIAAAYACLERAKESTSEPSEAALLARMNWWTAEYGLIGDLKNPKIYGAGLMSSVGESRSCLKPETKKIPFSLACLDFNYDITEPQPQVFVTPSFEALTEVLHEMSASMAFQRGGLEGLRKAVKAQTVNTVQLNSGAQISGRFTQYRVDTALDRRNGGEQSPCFIKAEGPCQICVDGIELPGQGVERHRHGFSSPIGYVKTLSRCLSEYTEADFIKLGWLKGQRLKLEFESGLLVDGMYVESIFANGKRVLMTFSNCRVSLGDETLFQPEWGEFDMTVGSVITSVFGGPADRMRYGDTEAFVAKVVKPRQSTADRTSLEGLYARVREMREAQQLTSDTARELDRIFKTLRADFKTDWLLSLEILELGHQFSERPIWIKDIHSFLESLSQASPEYGESIRDGLSLAQSL